MTFVVVACDLGQYRRRIDPHGGWGIPRRTGGWFRWASRLTLGDALTTRSGLGIGYRTMAFARKAGTP